jgi:hypothetical protein
MILSIAQFSGASSFNSCVNPSSDNNKSLGNAKFTTHTQTQHQNPKTSKRLWSRSSRLKPKIPHHNRFLIRQLSMLPILSKCSVILKPQRLKECNIGRLTDHRQGKSLLTNAAKSIVDQSPQRAHRFDWVATPTAM